MKPCILQINVAGTPRPCPRHRAIGGKIVAVIDSRVEQWQAFVAAATRQAIDDFGRDEIRETTLWSKRGSLFMRVLFRMPHKNPKCWGSLHTAGNAADLDNLEKLVMDEIAGKLKSPLPGNDSRICHKEGLKVWVRPREAGCTIILEETDYGQAMARWGQAIPRNVGGKPFWK